MNNTNSIIATPIPRTNIMAEMEQLQKQFYEQNGGKNMFFKKTQKNEIAKSVSENFELARLLSESIYMIGENEIIIDYPTIKMFIHEDIYENIVNHILNLYRECILTYGKFSVNINLNGFTVSAAERHKNAILLFSNICIQSSDFDYANLTQKLRIFNTPACIQLLVQMFKPFFANGIEQKIELLNKSESEKQMKILGFC